MTRTPARGVPVTPFLHTAEQTRLGPGHHVRLPAGEQLQTTGADVPPGGIPTGDRTHPPRASVVLFADLPRGESGGQATVLAATTVGLGGSGRSVSTTRAMAKTDTLGAWCCVATGWSVSPDRWSRLLDDPQMPAAARTGRIGAIAVRIWILIWIDRGIGIGPMFRPVAWHRAQRRPDWRGIIG